LDEQRVREIVREELAEQLKKSQPAIKITPSIEFLNVDAVTDRFMKEFGDRLQEDLQSSEIVGVYDTHKLP